MGLGIGIGISLLIEFLDNTLKLLTKWHDLNVLGIPAIGNSKGAKQ